MYEFPLRPTGIVDCTYPTAFPPPPELSNPHSPASPAAPSEAAQNRERSWLYYLAEISLRRMIMDTTEIMYAGGSEAWMADLPALLARYYECQEKVRLWFVTSYHIPRPAY